MEKARKRPEFKMNIKQIKLKKNINFIIIKQANLMIIINNKFILDCVKSKS